MKFCNLETYFFFHQNIDQRDNYYDIFVIRNLWSDRPKEHVQDCRSAIFCELNMFCFLFSFNIIVFFALYFNHWYVRYVHNLKHVHVQPLRTICQNTGFLWPVYSCFYPVYSPYTGVYRSEKTRILAYFMKWLCMHVFRIMYVTKNCMISTDRLTFFVINVYYSREMNGNLFVFNSLDIRSNAAFYIVGRDESCVWFL